MTWSGTRHSRIMLRVLLAIGVFWFAGMPIISMFAGAVIDTDQGQFKTQSLEKVFMTKSYLAPLLNTSALSFCVAALATVIGGTLAWITSRMVMPMQSLLEVGIMTPIFMSPFIGAIGWITLGQPGSGLINIVLSSVGLPQLNVFSFSAAVVVMALYFAAYAYSMMRHTMDRLNPEMEEAASICGGSPRVTLLKITLPMLLPSILSAFIFTFILSAEMFSVPGILLVPQGFEILSYDIYASTTRWPLDYSLSAAVGIMLLILTLVGIVLYAWVTRVQERFISIHARAPRRNWEGSFNWVHGIG